MAKDRFPKNAKREVRKAIRALNKSIVIALKAGFYPEIDILGEVDDWPEFVLREWVRFPKNEP